MPFAFVPEKLETTTAPPESKFTPIVPTKIIGSLKFILTEILSPTLYKPLGVDDVIDVIVGRIVSMKILLSVAIFVAGNVKLKLFKAASRAEVFTSIKVAVKSPLE